MKITLQKRVEEKVKGTDEKKIVVEKKEYSIPFVPASIFLEYLELEAARENPKVIKVQDARDMAKLIVKTYENQFTVEEFFEGIPSYELMTTIDDFVDSINKNPYPTPAVDDGGNAAKKAD